MYIIVHAGAGALIGQYASNPFLAFFYGVLSHFLLDLIPHGDNQLYQRYKGKKVSTKKTVALIILDSIAAIVFISLFFALDVDKSALAAAFAIIGAVIPDIFIGFYELLDPRAPRWLKIIHRWHFKNHDFISIKTDFSPKNGFIFQLIFFLLMLKIF